MSDPHDPTDQSGFGEDHTIENLFDVDTTGPYETQRTVQRYLSQETRHSILQVLLGHPDHLLSVTELDYYISKSRATISEQLADLADHEILAKYSYEPNDDVRDLPSDFWGYTPFGVGLITEYNYLRGLPIMRAVHDATHKTAVVKRHEAAPRPPLPAPVESALAFDEAEEVDTAVDQSVAELREQTSYADAAPADPSVLNADADGDRTLDELFG